MPNLVILNISFNKKSSILLTLYNLLSIIVISISLDQIINYKINIISLYI